MSDGVTVAEVAREVAPDASPVLTLPGTAWSGLAGRYRDVVAPCTEAPEAFHLASFIAAVGCLLGRKVWVNTPHKTFPNFYCLLVGSTGHTRKTTSYGFATNLLEDASLLLEAQTKRLNGLASVEGLAAAMRDMEGDEPFRVLCVEDEFRSLVTKGGQRAVANIIPKLTELFNCPTSFEVNTRKDPIFINEPTFCMLAATTRAWFEESLTGTDVSGGFLNRWLLFEGGADKLLPHPPAVNAKRWDDLVLDVCVAISNATGCYDFAPDASEHYASFYQAARARFNSEATARVDFHAKKLGLLYAVLSGHKRIELTDIQSGIAVAEYCAQIVEPLAARLDMSPQKRLEDRLLTTLADGPLSARHAYRKLHVSAGDLQKAVAGLRAVNQIAFEGNVYRLVE